MMKLIEPAACGIVVATFLGLGLTLAANPLSAQTNSPTTTVAQAATQPGGSPPTARSKRADRVEARIKQLHEQLKITAAQEPQWNAVAQAMRDDAAAMQSMIAKRRQDRSQMTAVDDLRSYQEVAETHVAGLQKLIPAFQALYDSMSPEQKKNADAVFSRRGRGGARHATKAPQQ